ncbi:ATP-binding protein, partial [Nostoc sp. NIES-2111]
MELVRAKRLVTERDKQLAVRVEELLEGIASRFDPTAPDGEGNRIEARALLVVGESGAGKTWTLRRHFREHPAIPGYGVPGSDCPLVTVPVKPPCTLMALGHQTSAATGYPIGGRLEAHRVWDRVYQRLADRGIFGVHFDEMHNFILTANRRDRRDVQNMLKTLMTNPSWPVFVVVSGLPVVQEFVEEACEDRRRMRVVHFAPLSSPAHNGRMAAMLREPAGAPRPGPRPASGESSLPRP